MPPLPCHPQPSPRPRPRPSPRLPRALALHLVLAAALAAPPAAMPAAAWATGQVHSPCEAPAAWAAPAGPAPLGLPGCLPTTYEPQSLSVV